MPVFKTDRLQYRPPAGAAATKLSMSLKKLYEVTKGGGNPRWLIRRMAMGRLQPAAAMSCPQHLRSLTKLTNLPTQGILLMRPLLPVGAGASNDHFETVLRRCWNRAIVL